MDFDEWADGKPVWEMDSREIWKAATLAEREACAELADAHGCDTGNLECQGCGEDIAADIRKRDI